MLSCNRTNIALALAIASLVTFCGESIKSGSADLPGQLSSDELLDNLRAGAKGPCVSGPQCCYGIICVPSNPLDICGFCCSTDASHCAGQSEVDDCTQSSVEPCCTIPKACMDGECVGGMTSRGHRSQC